MSLYSKRIVYSTVLLFILSACQLRQTKSEPLEIVAQPVVCECEDNEVSDGSEEPLLSAPIQPLVSCPVISEGKSNPEKQAQIPSRQAEAKIPKVKNKSMKEKLIIGRVEKVYLLSNELSLKARIDTGAGLSSLNGLDITEFERDGNDWVRFAVLEPKTKLKMYLERPVKRYVMIKQLGGNMQRRAVISMSLILGTIEEQVDMTLTDRSGYVYQLLIGRNFLRDRAIVDVSERFITKILEN